MQKKWKYRQDQESAERDTEVNSSIQRIVDIPRSSKVVLHDTILLGGSLQNEHHVQNA